MNTAACSDLQTANPMAKIKHDMNRAFKRSETVEIRIQYETNQSLMSRSRAEGISVRGVARSFIDACLADAACSLPKAVWEKSMAKFRT